MVVREMRKGYTYRRIHRQHPMHPLLRSLATWLMVNSVSHGEIAIKGQSSTTPLAYAGDVGSSDLINAGQPSLASASVSTSNASYPVTGINDGVCSNTWAANTFFQSGVHFPATATYQLNLTASPNGYDIKSITSLMGLDTYSQLQANQDYTVEVSVVGAAGFRPVANVKYTPFPAATGGSYESKVTSRRTQPACSPGM